MSDRGLKSGFALSILIHVFLLAAIEPFISKGRPVIATNKLRFELVGPEKVASKPLPANTPRRQKRKPSAQKRTNESLSSPVASAPLSSDEVLEGAAVPAQSGSEETVNVGKPDPDKYRYEKRGLSGFRMTLPKEPKTTWTAQPTYPWIEKNVLSRKCYYCHVSKGPVLMFYSALMTIVVPGQPFQSRLYEMTFAGKMPKGHVVSDEEQWAIYQWIKSGADR